MSHEPVIDDRSQEEVYEELQRIAQMYTDSWDPTSADNGRTLLRIFSHLGADIIRRLNDVPEKHRIAFLDALDFERRPPQAARLPLTFSVSTDLDRNVAIPGGTQAIADPDNAGTQIFEVPQERGFEATGATLIDVTAVDPTDDAIVDHDDLLDDDDGVTEVFVGENEQEHVLYMGHETLLNLESGSSVTVTAETNVDSDVFLDSVVWEYYGDDESGEEGWHRLEQPQDGDGPGDDASLEELQELLQSRSDTGHERSDGHAIESTFRLRGETVQTTVDGDESRWLRCRLVDDESDPFSVKMQSLAVSVGSGAREGGLAPDFLLANDVPLSLEDEGDILPFGRLPQPPATFYVASEEAFTKGGGVIDIEFHVPEVAGPSDAGDGADGSADGGPGGVGLVGGPPHISWEYWNGDGWTRIDGITDETNALADPGHVRFPVPDDIEATAVSGHDDVWIRARLVSGNYGQPSFDVTDAGTRGALTDSPEPPKFSNVSIHYDRGLEPFETVRRYDNASFSEDFADRSDPFSPFTELPDREQTIYLGFDDVLRNGPLSVFVPVKDTTYPRAFDPGIQWEYCNDPDAFEWSEIDVQDRTGGLTERGLVRFTFPEPTTAFDLFGRQRHWIRARITQDEFEREPRPTRPSRNSGVVSEVEGTDRTLERSTTPPVLDGIYPNTQWAYNTNTVENEILGSSDGSHDQSFEFAFAPVIQTEVWVDEYASLSSGERRELVETRPDAVERVTSPRGETEEFWVRWVEAADFLDSGPSDRNYVVDRSNGTVTFGDGNSGAIPPNGQDNLKTTYTTGGGRDGNVDTGTITDLKSSISLVESVSNPAPADGGADIESIDALVSRTTNQIKHRGKAVTAADYEQVSKAEFRELATVKCDPNLSGSGERASGQVTLLIVPQAEREKPVPSTELKQQVHTALRKRAPASLVESESARIVVRGPSYAEMAVELTLRASEVKSVSQLKGTISQRLDEYLHPLTGNGGDGWEFGAMPGIEELAAAVDDIENVSNVVDIGARIDVSGDRQSLSGRQRDPTLPRDALVCSGDHEITVTMEGDP